MIVFAATAPSSIVIPSFSEENVDDLMALGRTQGLTLAGWPIGPQIIAELETAEPFLAQRLVRKLCESCKQPIEIDREQRERLEIPLDLEGQAYAPKGCDHCRGTGFTGRLAIYEVAVVGNKMEDLIALAAPLPELKDQAIKDGYVPMREYGWRKVFKGETTVEEVISVTASNLVV